jgi:hypothetical protein
MGVMFCEVQFRPARQFRRFRQLVADVRVIQTDAPATHLPCIGLPQ